MNKICFRTFTLPQPQVLLNEITTIWFRVATNSEYGPNTEYIRFWKFNEYRIIRFLKIDRIPNTNGTIRTHLFKYRILNTEYWKLTDAHCHKYFLYKLNLWQKEKRRIWFIVFVAIWSFFLYFYAHLALWKFYNYLVFVDNYSGNYSNTK